MLPLKLYSTSRQGKRVGKPRIPQFQGSQSQISYCLHLVNIQFSPLVTCFCHRRCCHVKFSTLAIPKQSIKTAESIPPNPSTLGVNIDSVISSLHFA